MRGDNFMKKIILSILIVRLAFVLFINVNAKEYYIVFPDLAIRVRVVANSNSLRDQSIKMKVKEKIENTISPLLLDVDNVDDAREIIGNSVSKLENDISDLFDEFDYNESFIVNFGDNYFPEKDYRGVHYDEGEYESLVVTIGSGDGDNWWCCLFPPLCLLEASESESTDVEYQFFVTTMLRQIFS